MRHTAQILLLLFVGGRAARVDKTQRWQTRRGYQVPGWGLRGLDARCGLVGHSCGRWLQRVELWAHLDETGASVEVQMHILHLPKLGERLVKVVLLRLLVHVRHQDNPPLHSCEARRWHEPLSNQRVRRTDIAVQSVVTRTFRRARS